MDVLEPRRVLLLRLVARAGSLSAAARELGWTQPAVSQHLARLEREVGGALLIRGPAGVRLTEAGALLLRRADVVYAELRAATEEQAALAQLRAGHVRLVAFPSGAATLVPQALQAMARAHPEVRVGLEEAEPPEAMASVLAGDADLALVFGYGGPPEGMGGLTWRPLLDEGVHLVLPTGREPGKAQVRALAELAGADWIGGCVNCRAHLVACCRDAGFEPAVRHVSDDYVVVQNLVAHGLGVTVLPASALAAYRHPGVVTIELPELRRRRVGLALRAGAERVPATAALVERLVEAAGGAQPG